MKKRLIIFLVAIVAVFSAGVFFAACGGSAPQKVNVTFTENGQYMQTVQVHKGEKIEESKIPAYSGNASFAFAGWFIGDAPIADYVFDADTTVTAKLTKVHTVTFQSNETTVKTLKVRDGEKVAVADIPADPEIADYVFDGWFVGADAFSADAAITADTTVTAKLTKLHSVAFKSNETTLKTVKIRDGETLKAADFPADPIVSGYDFDGWYVGEEAFSKITSIHADTVVTAKLTKLHTVTFNANGRLYATLKVRDGETVAKILELGEPLKTEFLFDGWRDADGELFDDTSAVTTDIVLTAKFVQVVFTVTFVVGEEETVIKTNEESIFADTVVPQVDIPQGKVFAGWKDANGNKIKFTASNVLTEDATYTAIFAVKIATFIGAEGKTEARVTEESGDLYLWLNGKKLATKLDEKANDTYSCKVSGKIWTLIYGFNGEAVLTCYYYDGSLEDFVTDTYIFTAVTETDTAAYAGTYIGADKHKIGLADNGKLSFFDSDSTLFATSFTVEGNAITVKYADESGDFPGSKIYAYTGTIDGNILVLTGGKVGETQKEYQYYKGTIEDRKEYVATVNDVRTFLYVFKQGTADEAVLLYRYTPPVCYAFVTPNAAAADGAVLNFTHKDLEYNVKLQAGGILLFRDDVLGTYTCAGSDSVELDGFGVAKLGNISYTYRVFDTQIICYDGADAVYGIVLDKTDKTYEILTQNAVKGEYTAVSGTVTYYMIFDGYGHSRCYASNSSTIYVGTYTYIDGVFNHTISSTYSYGGDIKVYQDAKILVQTTNGKLTYVAAGYTPIEYDTAPMVGTWTSQDQTLIVNTTERFVSLNGKLAVLKVSYDGISFTIDNVAYAVNMKDGAIEVKSDATTLTFTKTSDAIELPVIVTDENLIGEFDYIAYDEYMEEEYTGKLTVNANGIVKIAEDGTEYKGAATFDGTTLVVVMDGRDKPYRYTFKYASAKYSLVSEYFYSGKWCNQWTATSVTKKLVVTSDFVGVFSGSLSGNCGNGDTTLTIDKTGNANITKPYSITFADYVKVTDGYKWVKDDFELTVTLGGGSYMVVIENALESYMSTGKFTKVEATSDALKGTWVKGKEILTSDGAGKCTLDNGTVGGIHNLTYTILGNQITFNPNTALYTTAIISADGQTVLVNYDDGEYQLELTFTKQ